MRAKALFVTSIAITALAAPLSAKARPFEDPRAALNPALDADTAFQAEPRDPACHTPVMASTGGALPRTRTRWRCAGPAMPITSSSITARSCCSTPISIAAASSPARLQGGRHQEGRRDSDRPWPCRSHVRCGIRRRANRRDGRGRASHHRKARHADDRCQAGADRHRPRRRGAAVRWLHGRADPGRHGDPPAALVGAFDAALKATDDAADARAGRRAGDDPRSAAPGRRVRQPKARSPI